MDPYKVLFYASAWYGCRDCIYCSIYRLEERKKGREGE